MGAALQLPIARTWVNTLDLVPDGFCPQCGVLGNTTVALPRIRGGKVVAEWRGCPDCRDELRAEMKARRR